MEDPGMLKTTKCEIGKNSHRRKEQDSGNEVSANLQKLHIIQWLRKRFTDSTKLRYLNTPSELLKHFEIEGVFKKFDED
jgi:hypothetical protein